MNTFQLGSLEVSPMAQRALADRDLDASVLFDRHRSRDWGDTPEWCRQDNDRATRLDSADHVIRSQYRLEGGLDVLVLTSPDRTRTRLQLATEYKTRIVDAREGYGVWAGWYDVWNPLVEIEEARVRPILAGLLPLNNAVDVGTGTGRHALWLAENGVEVIGLDDSPEMVAAAREKAAAAGLMNVRFEQATLGDDPLPAPSESFDLVVCALMLSHVPLLASALADCVRLVRPGGHLVLSDFHPGAVAFGWHTAVVTPDVYLRLPNAPHTREGFVEALQSAGCDVFDVQDISTEGEAYGDTSPLAVAERGRPPLCMIVVARRR